MSWRFIVFIVIFGVLLVFVAFNLNNRCDISFGFATIKDVPVFLTMFTSFVLGLLCTMPYVILAGRKRRERRNRKAMKGKIQELDEASPRNQGGAASDIGNDENT